MYKKHAFDLDMIQSLHWIQTEISNFGGNPGMVTVMGHSTAAASLMTLSPVSQGLFQQAIPMSGSGVVEASLAVTGAEQKGKDTNEVFAIQAGCATEEQWSQKDFQPILDCLRSKDGHELLLLQRKLDDQNIMFSGPRVDGPGGVFPAKGPELAKTRKPHTMMIGTVLREFGAVALQGIKNVPKSMLTLACGYGAQAFGIKHANPTNYSANPLIISECMRTYTADGKSVKEELAGLIDDEAAFAPAYSDAASMRDSGATVYLYSFEYVRRGMEGIGPYHAQDLTYVFGIHPFTFDSRDYQIMEIYPRLFSNFIKTGNPTSEAEASQQPWKPLSPKGYNYYKIDLPEPINQPLYHFRGVQFWTEIAPSINAAARNADGSLAAANQSVVLPATVGPSTGGTIVDWETAFWVTLVLGIVGLVGLLFLLGIQLCARKNFKQHYADIDVPDEKTSLLSSSGTTGSGSNNGNNGKKSYI